MGKRNRKKNAGGQAPVDHGLGRPGAGPGSKTSPSWSRRAQLLAGAIMALALLLRLLAVGQMQANDPFADRLLPDGDERSFQMWAERIAGGDLLGEGHYIQAPLYPYAMAVVFKLVGPKLAAIRYAQALLDTLTTGLLLLLAARLFTTAAALVAGLLYALSPVAIFFTTCVLRDSPMPFLLTLALLLAARAAASTDWRRWLALGMAGGLAHLCRENYITLTLLLAGWCLARPALRQAWPATLLPLLAGTLLVMLPVGLRNVAVGVNPLVITENGQVALVMGNAADASGVGYIVPPSADGITREYSGLLATGRAVWRSHAGKPWGLLELYLRKCHALVNNLEIANNENFYYASDYNALLRLSLPGFGLIWTLALAGMALTLADRQRRQTQVLPLLLLAMYAATVLLFFILSRFRLPLLPLLCGYAGFALVETLRLVRQRAWPRVALAGGVALLTGVAAFTTTGYEREHGTQRHRDYTTRAQMAMADHDLPLAEAMLERAVADRPAYAMAHLKLGNVRMKGGDTVAARGSFATAAELQPTLFEAWMNLGLTQYLTGDTAAAAASYRRALALQPANEMAQAQLQFLTR